ncbi:[lysine-biosynthesis-protein LysW]--L-2-aminoadipate ligase [Streptosporangium becharense]|uniref:[lysine-biosynthesis-protein LysW]--L-2-aminoadipate ligase n=1 Tax=Streptosporangium becharense TaxID=1816182 RepID=A0A7W9ILW2_9ACTN|nr:RimK family alpha-L-glutamate ligase [Streptosporangium becharense]MBB2910416.1 [lysine-biosynthesis-protein LysW]--L-2-aminoadipate ligase [Streptosporangium becharense]MBB5823159.1 [lysine-biosynthesis-protein LysW]--L-2-aminoadipate ligase [Streptosporangium becharense]
MSESVAVVSSTLRVEEKHLLAALRGRGVPVVHVDDRTLAYRVGAPPPPWRLVLNRSAAATRRLEVSRICEAWGIPVVNGTATVGTCDNKIATTLALARHGLPVPVTAVALTPQGGMGAVREVGLPAVLKPVNGSWGRGLCRLNDDDAVEGVLALRGEAPSPVQRLVYVQEFVRTPGRDIRVLVAGDRVVAAMYRRSAHWVVNTARGASVEACPLTGELESLALRAAAAVGGGILGVDLMEHHDGRLVVGEVNCGVEFHGLMEVAGDVAGALVDYALEQEETA